MSSAQMILLKSLSFLELSLLSQAWEKFPLPPSAAGGVLSAGETVARWFPALQSPAAVSRDFRRRQGAPKRAPHPFSQARLTHLPSPTTPLSPTRGPSNAYTHPDQMVFQGSASWSQPLSNHTYASSASKIPESRNP